MTPEEKRLRRIESTKRWRAANPDKVKEYVKRWRAANPDKVKESTKKWRAANPDRARANVRRSGKKINENRRAAYNAFKERIGCLNPECKWLGEYVACTLDFHHLNESEKAGCVSQMVGTPDEMKREMSKCTLLCANCHRLVTYGELDDTNLPRCEV